MCVCVPFFAVAAQYSRFQLLKSERKKAQIIICKLTSPSLCLSVFTLFSLLIDASRKSVIPSLSLSLSLSFLQNTLKTTTTKIFYGVADVFSFVKKLCL